MEKYTKTCSNCGSDSVELRKFEQWCNVSQTWVSSSDVETYCPDCGSDNIEIITQKTTKEQINRYIVWNADKLARQYQGDFCTTWISALKEFEKESCASLSSVLEITEKQLNEYLETIENETDVKLSFYLEEYGIGEIEKTIQI